MYEGGKLMEIDINDIIPNRFQPRIRFDEQKLTELSESIRKYGVIQPIVVRPINNKYEIIAGERRYKASQLANRPTIPCIVVNMSDKESEEIALLENIQRQELTAIEEAVSYKRILDMGYVTQEGLAKKLGKSQSTIANKVRLLNLDDKVQDALLHGKISERHARSLLKLNNEEEQIQMLNRIVENRWTVKKTDDEINKIVASQPPKPKEIIITPKPVVEKKEEVENLFEEEKPKQETKETNENLFEEEKPKQEAKPVGIRELKPQAQEEKPVERRRGFMDIDKIIKEAKDIKDINKDINKPKPVNDIADLMKQDEATKTEPVQTPLPKSPVQEEKAIESSKFLNFDNAVRQETDNGSSTPFDQTMVNFDSIFNQNPVDIAPSSTPEQTPEQNKPFYEQATQETPSVLEQIPEPQPSEPVQVESPAIEQPIAQVEPAPTIEQEASIAEPVQVESPAIEPEASNVEPVQVESPEPKNNNLASTIASVFSSQKKKQDEIQPSEPVQVESPTIEQPIAQVEPAPIVEDSVVTAVSYPQQPIAQAANAEDNVIKAVSYPQQPTPPVVNIPSDDILYEQKSAPDPSIEEMEEELPISVPTRKAAPASNFRQAINLIRDCAEEIERLGFYIDVDEIDLGEKYQVTFRIDKEQ